MTLSTLSSYGIHFQTKVISSLLTHKEFLVNIHDIISEEYFDNSAHKWVISEILKYYDKYHTTPSMEVLKVLIEPINNIFGLILEQKKSSPSRIGFFNLKLDSSILNK